MFKKYHIPTESAISKKKIGKFLVERNLEYCINCGDCVKACLYDVHKRRQEDVRIMAEPDSYKCKSCFRCIIECPRGALSLHDNPEFFKLGDSYYTPKMVKILWNEAENGRVPVSGAGYRGDFSGPRFDGIWTDMSEIVRPTRDGIHGREYISTAVDLGRKLPYLKFDSDKNVEGVPPNVEIPIPILFNPPPHELTDINLQLIVANVATKLGTYAIINAEDYQELCNYNVIPRFPLDSNLNLELVKGAKIVELDYRKNAMEDLRLLKNLYSDILVSIRIPLKGGLEPLIVDLTKKGAEIFHLYADYQGNEFEQKPRFITDSLRSIDDYLVDNCLRDQITIIASGGIGAAEHVPKTIACGANVVGIDIAYLIALEIGQFDTHIQSFSPIEATYMNLEWGTQRIINLMNSWRDQLLEVLGAMGMREVRRLQGETGRMIFHVDEEKELYDLVGLR